MCCLLKSQNHSGVQARVRQPAVNCIPPEPRGVQDGVHLSDTRHPAEEVQQEARKPPRTGREGDQVKDIIPATRDD